MTCRMVIKSSGHLSRVLHVEQILLYGGNATIDTFYVFNRSNNQNQKTAFLHRMGEKLDRGKAFQAEAR